MKIRVMVWAAFLLFLSIAAYSQTQPDTTLSFPQVADGPAGGGNTLVSCIGLYNSNNATALVTLQFYLDNGTPWLINVNIPGVGRRSGSTIQVSVPPRGSVLVMTTGDSPRLLSGWTKGTSSIAVAGTLQYSIIDGSANLLGQAGWGISKPVRIFSIAAYNDSVQGTTGLAWSNPGTSTAVVTAVLVRADGTQVQTKTVFLPPNNHQSLFLKDPAMFNLMPPDGFTGTAYFMSTADITPVALVFTGPVFSGLAIVQLTSWPF